MARLRVYLVGIDNDDLIGLRARVASEDGIQIVGAGLVADLQRTGNAIPPSVDAVLMSPAAMRSNRRESPRAPLDAQQLERPVEALTGRERDVLALVADGRPNRDIAHELGISEHTVKFHLSSIFGKLGASTRTEAVRRGLELGLIEI